MRKIFIGNIFLLTLEHDHFDCLLEFAAENHFHLEKLHVQSFLDLFQIFQVDTQHTLLFIFEWRHSCKVIWDVWIVLFLFLSVSVQRIVRSSILRQYVLGTHEFRDDLLENKSFLLPLSRFQELLLFRDDQNLFIFPWYQMLQMLQMLQIASPKFVPVLLWIIFPYFICCVSFFMIMFDKRFTYAAKGHYNGFK